MARRVVLFILAAVAFLVGLALLLPGIVIAALFGSDGTVSASPHLLRTPTAALVTPSTELSTGGLQAGSVRIELTTEPGLKPVFLGVAPTADLNRYLGSVPVDELSDVSVSNGFSYQVTRRGSGAPAALPPPTSQTFWVAKATGTGSQAISWNSSDGSYSVVLMNADGSTGVSQQVGAGLHLSFMWPLALTMIVIGAVLLALSVLFVILGVLSRPAPTGPGAYRGGYPGGYPPGAYPPNAYPPNAYPPNAYPPNAHPPAPRPAPEPAYEPAPQPGGSAPGSAAAPAHQPPASGSPSSPPSSQAPPPPPPAQNS
jgi:hypothetical protein